ncbi:uncharacterized protein LOC117792557 [Drosophila innubila]|uniref:uncharacterized protein LOC117792557 n=1 Tax=Drosophila innubila TaxID=198719 RepID=UPI00148BB1ED|nr:uncharacterized protein LOC117792557 [Drosophila innubila]XP_034488638.1 uncharacterized protein LOC117792557 [Drosophila innubila]XP_034488639.1 uncharacterized protein LOC117792557 [Drosophila innubila]
MLMPRYSEQDNHTENTFVGKNGHATHTTVAAHTKMRLLSKVEQNMRQNQQNLNQNQNPGQSQCINKLINTAATGNGLVGDVDELLTPMRSKAEYVDRDYSPSNGSKDSHSRPERNLWSRAEMLEMLNIMQQMNALDQLNDRNVKSEHVFRQIEDVMRSKGYVKKSSIQIWTKWKFLKSTYNTTTRHGNGIPKVVPEEVYRVLCRMLTEHGSGSHSGNGSGSGIGIGSECGNSMDSSNAELHKTIADGEDPKEELGVEHPIFGFRLGLVKPEPLDTGYETTLNQGNSSEQEIDAVDFVHGSDSMPAQTLEHTPFMVTVKSEPEMDLGMDGTNTPPPTAPTSPSPPPIGLEQRDNGDRSHLYTSPSLSTSMPPLRVAAFANDARRVTSTPTHGVLQIERPGPLLSKSSIGANPPGKGNRTMPLQSTSSINFVHPTSKLMLPRKQLPLRIPREISLQPASTRPLKAVPIRETGYSLRPDRMIPDLEQSISPPQSPSPPMHSQSVPKFNIPYASTSRQAQQFNEQLHPLRKRRLNFQHQSTPVPVKLQRSSGPYEHKHHGSIPKHDVNSGEEHRMKVVAEETQRRKQQQEEIFKKELGELASAMRDAQKEMLEDFFQRQKQLARREHEFQLRQDNLVMSALRKQTNALLQTARQLIKPEEKDVAEPQQNQHQEQQLQRETKTNTSNELVDDASDHEEHDQEMEEDYDEDEDDTQYSEEGNQSESAMVISSLALSEDASSHSEIPSDRQLS